jgi:hypothetical protein
MLTETLAAVRVTAAASDKNYRMEVFASPRFDLFFPGLFECPTTSFSCYRINWKLTTWTPSIFPPVLDYLPSLFPLLFAVRHLLSRFLLCRLSAFGCCGLEPIHVYVPSGVFYLLPESAILIRLHPPSLPSTVVWSLNGSPSGEPHLWTGRMGQPLTSHRNDVPCY